ncbi:MAG TPA: PQQ-binding-like beta-propeller repeat protein [Pirellulales bacterium]|nr:PQQ-binding-like beta-propeller repeat protein [Pirellulales bacterium]
MTPARIVLSVISLALAACSVGTLQAETRWPRWRGPQGDGQSTETTLPITWDKKDVVWRVSLPGVGESSPIIWLDKLFLTTSEDGARQRSVLCLDRASGELLWKQTVEFAGRPEELHKMNTFASPTCVTDGEVVVAFFGRAGLHAYSLDGTHLWSKELGQFNNPWGVGASPVIVGDLVIQNGDADSDAFLAAYDKRTGETVWNVPRPNHRGWSTPILLDVAGRQELVLNGHKGVTAYNPATGEELWFCASFNGRGEPTATPGDGLVFLVNGLAGDVYAVKPGGEGDVTKTRMAWHTPRLVSRDLPSPIVIDKHVIVVSMDGVAVCYNAADGGVVWRDRLGGNFSASPIAAAGYAYFLGEDGSMTVIKPGKRLEIVARNQIEPEADEVFRASPAPCEGQLFLRSDRALYCVGQESQAAAAK